MPPLSAAASSLSQVGDTVYGQKFARGGRGGSSSDGGSFKHEAGTGGDAAKMNSGDIFKKLSREVRAQCSDFSSVCGALARCAVFVAAVAHVPRHSVRRLLKPVFPLPM